MSEEFVTQWAMRMHLFEWFKYELLLYYVQCHYFTNAPKFVF